MMSQFSANGQVNQGRPRGCPRGQGRGRGRGQAQPNPHGVINLDDDPMDHNYHQAVFQVNPQPPINNQPQASNHPPPPPVAGPSHVIQHAHIIGGAQANPHVDGLNHGHIARRDNAAGHHHSISAYQNELSQQNHQNCMAQQMHEFQIDQPMHQPQHRDDKNMSQPEGEEDNDAQMSQNYHQYHQALDRDERDDFDENQHLNLNPEIEEHLRQIDEQEAENLHQHGLPTAHKAYVDPPDHHSLGAMDVECQHCRALHFDGEKLSDSTWNNKKFGLCCLQGQIKLPLLTDPPRTLHNLLYGQSPLSSKFHDNI